jgi:hypothetical protein
VRRRQHAQAELLRCYVAPQLDRPQRAACRDYRRVAFGDPRKRPAAADFDPLWLRLGMRAFLVEQRAGWVVNNPMFDETLRRRPDMDPSLPGPGWLREVYRWRSYGLVTLPGVRARIDARLAALRAKEMPTQSLERDPVSIGASAQGDLFAGAVA